jgi:hypothetical protein
MMVAVRFSVALLALLAGAGGALGTDSPPVGGAQDSGETAVQVRSNPSEKTTLAPGDVLDADNWRLGEGLLPPEVLRHYKSGQYANKIIAWPNGGYRWEPSFNEATIANRERFTVNARGTVLERSTGEQPPFVYGLPFPEIDTKDPNAGIKILWNYQYHYWSEGNSHNVVRLSWVNPADVDREAVQDVRFLYYDGQDERYRLPNPNNFSMQFVSVATSPADLNGTASLTWRYRDSDRRDSNWVYVPALRRVRAVSPANRSDGFLGSDMSQDDGPFFDGKPEDFTWKLVGEGEMLRLVDPNSFSGRSKHVWMEGGGWRSKWVEEPIVGYQAKGWSGLAWAPLTAALARRPCWIVEGVPRDRYYLYGKIQLYIDKETYQGAWNRKFSWTGELVNTLQVLAYQKTEVHRPDGGTEWLWGASFAYQCAENIKLNRATVGGLLPEGLKFGNGRRLVYNPRSFDFKTLHRFGK